MAGFFSGQDAASARPFFRPAAASPSAASSPACCVDNWRASLACRPRRGQTSGGRTEAPPGPVLRTAEGAALGGGEGNIVFAGAVEDRLPALVESGFAEPLDDLAGMAGQKPPPRLVAHQPIDRRG